MGKRFTQEEFIRRSKIVHGDRYDYSKVVYTNNRTKVTIVCPRHGEFEQAPVVHLGDHGCRVCGYQGPRKTRRVPYEEFVRRARLQHGDRYTYYEDTYKGTAKPIKILCPEHGPFMQVALSHAKGSICPKCDVAVKRANRIGKTPYKNGFPVRWINHYKRIAAKRGLAFTIDTAYLLELAEKQHRCCAYTGQLLVFPALDRHRKVLDVIRESTASIDRIDSGKGYIPGNVQWVHKDVNRMKYTFTETRFIELCRLVTERADSIGQ